MFYPCFLHVHFKSDIPAFENFEDLCLDVSSLCNRVASLVTRNARDRLAKAGTCSLLLSKSLQINWILVSYIYIQICLHYLEMGKQVLNLHQVVHSPRLQDDYALSPGQAFSSSQIEKLIEQLRLPEDYALQELKSMVRNHLSTLTSGRNDF